MWRRGERVWNERGEGRGNRRFGIGGIPDEELRGIIKSFLLMAR
jgi:hypothetical protein